MTRPGLPCLLPRHIEPPPSDSLIDRDDLRFSFGWKIIQENIVKTSMHQKHLIFAWK